MNHCEALLSARRDSADFELFWMFGTQVDLADGQGTLEQEAGAVQVPLGLQDDTDTVR